ncbi:MAG: hypothetical protein HFF89_03480 [Oscillibacter sp.]|nr:hypothetical protein [Oscillibacter sp.]MCI8689795.1 hypothetical protein [Oscillibacter sp.]MCI8849241.1 hypothetical protein [Oscillibacter sp.]MCI9374837.1 hypothetical protein [Oscillibacter sp.]MCI9481962.1 hypothetical protein [Oscillibacter sp.]
MERDRLEKILKGLRTCAVVSLGVFVLYVLVTRLLRFAIGCLFAALISGIPH